MPSCHRPAVANNRARDAPAKRGVELALKAGRHAADSARYARFVGILAAADHRKIDSQWRRYPSAPWRARALWRQSAPRYAGPCRLVATIMPSPSQDRSDHARVNDDPVEPRRPLFAVLNARNCRHRSMSDAPRAIACGDVLSRCRPSRSSNQKLPCRVSRGRRSLEKLSGGEMSKRSTCIHAGRGRRKRIRPGSPVRRLT